MRHSPLALVVITACSQAPRTPVPELPLTVRITEGTTRYGVVEHRHVEQAYHDQPIVTDATTSLVLSITLTRDDSGFAAAVVVDSIGIVGDAALPPLAVQSATGRQLHGRFTLPGDAPSFPPPEPGDPVLDQLTLSLHDLLPSLPPRGVTPASEWTDSTTVHGRTAGLPITITASTMYRTGSWSDFGGTPVLEVTGRTQYALAGEGDRLGQWISMRGNGTATTTRLLTPHCAVAQGVRVDSLSVDVEVQATGIVIPVLQTRVDTIRQVLP